MLLTTHYLDEADQLCGRLCLINDGRVIIEGTPDELKTKIGGDRLDIIVTDAIELTNAAHLLVGWRPHGTPAETAGAVGLLLLLRFAILWLGIYLGLILRAQSAVTFAQMLVWPIGFLSSIFVAPAIMPGWLGRLPSSRRASPLPCWRSETSHASDSALRT